MKVRYDEGLAIHIGPEPCVTAREGGGEASAGERMGRPLSRERLQNPGADAVVPAEGNMEGRVIASARPTRRGLRHWHVRTLPWTGTGRSHAWPGRHAASGPQREGGEPKPLMHGHERSNSAIVARKPANKAGRPAAEPVERRAGTEGKAGQQSTRRAQDRESVSQALDRIRQVASQRPKERFTTLYHHLTVPMLRMAFLALNPGLPEISNIP